MTDNTKGASAEDRAGLIERAFLNGNTELTKMTMLAFITRGGAGSKCHGYGYLSGGASGRLVSTTAAIHFGPWPPSFVQRDAGVIPRAIHYKDNGGCMIDEKKLAELIEMVKVLHSDNDHIVFIQDSFDGTKSPVSLMFDTLEAALKVVRAAQAYDDGVKLSYAEFKESLKPFKAVAASEG